LEQFLNELTGQELVEALVLWNGPEIIEGRLASR